MIPCCRPIYLVKDLQSASKFVGLEKSLTCQNCNKKIATVKQRVHESQFSGREKAGRFRTFSCNVHDRDGVELENVEAFTYHTSFMSLQRGELNEISVKLCGRKRAICEFLEAVEQQTIRCSPQMLVT